MGVQVWYARKVLPESSSSLPVATSAPAPKPASVEVPESVAKEQVANAPLESSQPAGQVQQSKERAAHSRKPPIKKPAPQFDLVTLHCADRLLIIGDIGKTNSMQLTPAQSRLLAELASALGVSTVGAKYNQFTWPVSPSEHVDQSESVAVDAVWGFYKAQISKQQVNSILVMGSLAARYLLPDEMQLAECRGKLWSIGELPALITYGVDKMLENPLLKKEVWRDVQPIIKLLEEAHDS